METILMDSQHIQALSSTILSFSKEGDRVQWYSRDCAYKFLVINGRLVIAPINGHDELYAVYRVWGEPVNEAKSKIHAIAKEQWDGRNHSVTGAGKIGIDGKVTGWKSECFRVETPVYMREEIEREVARLFQAGDLNHQ